MKRLFFLVFVLLLWTSCLKAQNSNILKLDSLFTAIENYNKGMGSISIFHNGEEIYQRSYGYANVDNQIKNNANTKFRIGSISKAFTATIIMKLIEEGKLTLASKLSDYYPQVNNSNKITIEHLLQHRSGIPNFIDMEDYMVWSLETQTKEELLNRITSGKASFEPNDKFEYSNSNYVLLTHIAEDVSSKNFSDLLNEIIIIPCNLNNTYVGGKINSNKEEAYSYMKLSANWVMAKETDMSVPLGSGFIVSNAYDLNKFLYCLFLKKIVNQESLNRMISLKDNFGLGLFQVPFHNNIGYGHTGGIDGFQANAFYFPQENMSISLVENGVVYMLNNIVIGCLNIYFGRDYSLPQFSNPIEINTEELDKYLGVYSSPALPIKFAITKKENTLIVQGTGQQELPLECISNNVFQCEGVDLVLKFVPEDNKVVLEQLGMTFEMSKELQ
ncbi:serine hydrolase domain-containing protein [Parabacteroides sp. PF5-9]|uniref:serine hydrolase domain-containing protein n=1 Tax=Parabacteroides sp. PF5-9 TaxID=1742404 RepID=UPI00247534CA|nr:serine hydrolase domain-containing protein [Parabacteroides sp. PF5-9]MDH6356545.1 D-alanyl-D-alanine carboxypeptidase [Parabacteroides sp. PF5-9]